MKRIALLIVAAIPGSALTIGTYQIAGFSDRISNLKPHGRNGEDRGPG